MIDVPVGLLSRGKAPIYVASRLFDPAGRWFGQLLAKAVEEGATRALRKLGLPVRNPTTFLPFRDSNEVVKPRRRESITRAIFRADITRVTSAAAIIAPLYDLHYDSGVCFEAGYAAASRVPLIVLATNFFSVGRCGDTKIAVVEELFSKFAQEVIALGHDHIFARTEEPYSLRTARAIAACESKIAESIYKLLLKRRLPSAFPKRTARGRSIKVFLEFGGGQFEFQRQLAGLVSEALSNCGMRSVAATRHLPRSTSCLSDVRAMLRASVCVFHCDGWDVDPETAFLLGAAKARNKRIVVYWSGSRRLIAAHGYDVPMNLMIAEASDVTVNTVTEIEVAVRSLI